MSGARFDGGAPLGDTGLDPTTAQTVRRIARAGFRCLWEGRTPLLAELVDAGAVLDEAVAHLQARGRIELSADGRLLAVHGLSHRTTRHRIEHATGRVHTWCAFDAVGIPAGLGINARAVTGCPTCGRELVVTLVGGQPTAVGLPLGRLRLRALAPCFGIPLALLRDCNLAAHLLHPVSLLRNEARQLGALGFRRGA
jgi:hypothetical protein